MSTLENDITEAIFAAEDALQHLYQAKTFLKKARNWGLFDIFAGGLIRRNQICEGCFRESNP